MRKYQLIFRKSLSLRDCATSLHSLKFLGSIHYSKTILKALGKSKCRVVENGDASFPFLSSILQSTRKSTATLKNTVQISRKKTGKTLRCKSKYNRVKIWWLWKKKELQSLILHQINLITDYGRPVRKSPSLHGRKSNSNPKFKGTT